MHCGTDVEDICLFQTHDQQFKDIRSLVRFFKQAHPETTLRFVWNIDYGFIWSKQCLLVFGFVFESSRRTPPI